VTREEKINYCKECSIILKDYHYVNWVVMEDYQIDNWVVFFKQELKNGKVIPFHRGI
jgi:hypothetical protein